METLETLGTLDKVVNRGIEYLDDTYPGWRETVNWDLLCQNDPDSCVLGQVTGRSFWNTREYLEMGSDWCRLHGFLHPEEDQTADYPALTSAWKAKSVE